MRVLLMRFLNNRHDTRLDTSGLAEREEFASHIYNLMISHMFS
jgi:hypothetical protein